MIKGGAALRQEMDKMEKLKRILIVDDSEIDREILKSIFANEFDIIEADNGYSALEIILNKKEHLDAVLLDVSMPVLDGLSVLRLLREENFDNVPVFMITAEATKDNIEKASQYNISEFIRKPFDRDEILKRVRLKLGVMTKHSLTDVDIAETKRYITALTTIYDRYLNNFTEEKERNERRSDLMKLLLKNYSAAKGKETDDARIDIISKAAYFCNIGNMLIPNPPSDTEAVNGKMNSEAYQQHTVIGAELIQLNYSEHCKYFVQICADMCLHHHERYDGKGFPHGIYGNNNSVPTQMCGLLDRFDALFFRYREHNKIQFDFVVGELGKDNGAFSPEVLALLANSRFDILAYYNKNYI